MPDPIAFSADGHPKGQPRPRAFVRGGRAAVYDAGTAEGWKGIVAAAARPHMPAEPLRGPLAVTMHFHMPRPKRLQRAKDPQPAIPHTSKPDADNLAKAVLDALTQAGFWCDDDQVYSLLVTKHYTPKDGRPGAEIRVLEATRDA